MPFSSGRSIITTHLSHNGNKRQRGGKVESDATPFADNIDVSTAVSTHILFGDHHVESYRLGTLSPFPAWAPIKIYDLARAGFYYLGFRDRVECFSCGARMENWIVSDNALSPSHHFQGCAMALGTDEMNVPLPTGMIYGLMRQIIEAIALRTPRFPVPVEIVPATQESAPNDPQEAEDEQGEEVHEIQQPENIVTQRPVAQVADAIGDLGDDDNIGDRPEEATEVVGPGRRRERSDSTVVYPAKKMRQHSPGSHNREPDPDDQK